MPQFLRPSRDTNNGILQVNHFSTKPVNNYKRFYSEILDISKNIQRNFGMEEELPNYLVVSGGIVIRKNHVVK